MTPRRLLFGAPVVCTARVPACSDQRLDCVCTEVRAVTLTVVDIAWQPTPDIEITRVHLPTGVLLEPASIEGPGQASKSSPTTGSSTFLE